MEIIISNEIKEICPSATFALIRADVTNTQEDDGLWSEIKQAESRIASSYELAWINKRPAISATRTLYKYCGKDPNRYRVSSEALCRRVVKGLGLYKINTVVDLINLVSMASGYAIGGFDADKIVGNTITWRIGMPEDKFEGIGRGVLNVAGLPIYCDAIGGIGSPTSDEERTKITTATTKVQIQINAFAEEMPLEETVAWTIELLQKYANGRNIEVSYFK